MVDKIQTSFISNPHPPSPKKVAVQTEPPRQDLPVDRTSFGLLISAEAQYLFEMDKYLSDLDDAARDKALEFLSKSEDSRLKGLPEYFHKSQSALDRALGEDRSVTIDRTESEKARKLLDVSFELNSFTEVAVVPLATKVFRLDESENFYPVALNARNDEANSQLDTLERISRVALGNQDSTNLFWTVRNALSASENILLSFDDVLHFNYSIEKASTAIASIAAPASLKSELTSLLNQSIDYQSSKQSKFLQETAEFTTNSRVSESAIEDILMGTAAQKFNNLLHDHLATTGSSILSARALAEQLLTQHPDLIRFGADKVNEAFEFYENDLANFKKVLVKDFSTPPENKTLELGGTTLEAGQAFAKSVISRIDKHLRG